MTAYSAKFTPAVKSYLESAAGVAMLQKSDREIGKAILQVSARLVESSKSERRHYELILKAAGEVLSMPKSERKALRKSQKALSQPDLTEAIERLGMGAPQEATALATPVCRGEIGEKIPFNTVISR